MAKRAHEAEVKHPVPHYAHGLPFRLASEELPAQRVEQVQPLQSMEDLHARAASGDSAATLALGTIAWLTPDTASTGAAWLIEAARAGDAHALHRLGLACFRGQGVEQDLVNARRLQRAAASRGVVEAQFELSLLLALGLGGRRDLRGAKRWEAKAAEAGHPRACLNRATRLATKKRRDLAAARYWYERAAEAGSAEAAARLCQMHLAGQGVAQDDGAAKRWFERAAALGHDWSTEQRE